MTDFQSINPATQTVLWEGKMGTAQDVDAAVQSAKNAFASWMLTSFDERVAILNEYQKILEANEQKVVEGISDEVGKPLWEAKTEYATMKAKLANQILSYHDRTPDRRVDIAGAKLVTHHRPHGVMGVIGPFNFPGHLPTGHIIPCLLAGNTVVFKPSELTPMMGEMVTQFFMDAGLPKGVLNLVQGADEVGKAIVAHPDINGILFTGSYAVGKKIHEAMAPYPEKIVALEMGGNNPLVVEEVKDIDAAVVTMIQSSFITTGQRCTCGRRVMIPAGAWGDRLIERLVQVVQSMRVDVPSATPEPFMSTLVTKEAAQHVLNKQDEYINNGAKQILRAEKLPQSPALISPGILDITDMPRVDEEIFGPLMQIIRVKNFDEAMLEANRTRYGLSSAIITDSEQSFKRFYAHIHAGLVNWNKPTTGASGLAPFGGVGCSGNHRPTAYYAADYAAYPCVSMESPHLTLPDTLPEGISL